MWWIQQLSTVMLIYFLCLVHICLEPLTVWPAGGEGYLHLVAKIYFYKKIVLSHLAPKAFDLPKVFTDCKCVHCSLWVLILPFLLANVFFSDLRTPLLKSGKLLLPFVKRDVCTISENMFINRKERMKTQREQKTQLQSSKYFGKFKSFGAKLLRTN